MQVVLFVTQRHETPQMWLKIHLKYSYKSERVQLEDVPSKEISLAYIVNHSINQLHTGLSLVLGGVMDAILSPLLETSHCPELPALHEIHRSCIPD